MSLFRSIFCVLLFAGLFPFSTLAAPGDVWVTDAWMRPVILLNRPGGAYMTITNKGAEDDRLLSVSSPVAERIEIHRHLHENGIMNMVRVDHMPVPGGQQSKAAPGGYHLMIFGISKKIALGEMVPLILTFEKAGSVETMATVMKRSPATMPH